MNLMTASFEMASLESIPHILAMMEAFNAIDHYPFHRERTEKILADFLGTTELGKLWLIRIDGELIGYIVLTFGFSFEYKGKDAFIDEFFIKKGFRNRGIGKKTLEFALSEAKKMNVKALHLEVENHNRASRLYKKIGFAPSQRTLLTKRLKR